MQREFLELVEEAAFEALTSRERSALFRHYGVAGYGASTLEQIGESFKISRERVRQIVNKATAKIISRSQHKTVIDSPSACQKLGRLLKEHINNDDTSVDAVRLLVDSGLIEQEEHIRLALVLSRADPRGARKSIAKAKKSIAEAQKRLKAEARIDEKFDRVLKGVEWPTSAVDARVKYGKQIDQKRDTQQNDQGLYECFDSKKAGRHIYYDSELEHSFYQLLEGTSLVEYYAEQPFMIKYGECGDLKYYPDVYVLLKDGRGIVFEVKPSFMMPLRKNLVKYKALENFCKAEGLGYSMSDITTSFSELRLTEVRREYELAVLEAVKLRSLNWTQYLKVKEHFNPTKEEFCALIFRNNLVWQEKPFRLSK